MIRNQVILPLPLNRPEYVAVPEAFITALAGKLYKSKLLGSESNQIGLFFEGPHPKSKSLEFVSTRPQGEDLASFAAALDTVGIKAEENTLETAEAVLNSILGIKVERSQIHPASPLSPSIAMLQNVRGLLRKGNPADIARILEAMYSFGSSEGGNASGAADRWQKASEHRLTIDPLLRALDTAVDVALLKGKESLPFEADANAAKFSGSFEDTPYEWFAQAWDRLTEPQWVEALPARVWVDWATTILRLAYGFGFLWESAWYVALARDLQRESQSTWEELKSQVGAVVPWVSSRAGATARDVAPRLVSRIHQGERVRRLLIDQAEKNPQAADFDDLMQQMHGDETLRGQLLDAITNNRRESSGNNLWEATKYALLARGTSDQNPDYYGVLHANGRYLTVSPGTEWVAVVASLACEIPGGRTDVGTVLDSLEKLGMRPELSDLVDLLERAGMARGSADADRGVMVESAF
jgi:hypothetical protein